MLVTKSHSDCLEIDYVRDLVMETLKLLETVTREPCFYHVINSIHKQLLLDGCLPLLPMTREEFETISSDPSEFVLQTLDYVQKGESDTVKVAAVRLMGAIAERIDGVLTYIT